MTDRKMKLKINEKDQDGAQTGRKRALTINTFGFFKQILK